MLCVENDRIFCIGLSDLLGIRSAGYYSQLYLGCLPKFRSILASIFAKKARKIFAGGANIFLCKN
jgi:hypothetical protein